MPQALLIGATGPTGREVFAYAPPALGIRAMARSPQPLRSTAPAHIEVVQGDVLNPASLLPACKGVDLVICTLGIGLTRKPVTLFSEGTRNLMAAMRETGVDRLLCVTGVGAGDSRGHGGFLYDKILQPLLLNTIYQDKDRQESLIKASDLQWTLIRPGALTNGPMTGSYRVMTTLHADDRLSKISRKDVAHFLVQEALQNQYVRQTANLTR